MKYVEVPESETLYIQDPDTEKPMVYTLSRLLSEHVWNSPDWRTNGAEWMACLLRLMDKFEVTKPGDEIEVLDKDHEKLVSLASLPGIRLDPGLVKPFTKLLYPLLNASDSPRKVSA